MWICMAPMQQCRYRHAASIEPPLRGDQILWELKAPGNGDDNLAATTGIGPAYGWVSYTHASGVDRPPLKSFEIPADRGGRRPDPVGAQRRRGACAPISRRSPTPAPRTAR
jgi:hypothetical protein